MKIISSVPDDQRLLDFAKQNSYHDYNHALDGFIFLSKRRGIQNIFSYIYKFLFSSKTTDAYALLTLDNISLINE